MWNRTEEEAPGTTPGGAPGAPRGGRATIGPSITFKGQLEGKEDLLVDGTFQGEIHLRGHQVTVGRSGKVRAEIQAKVIVIEGELEGNIDAEQQAVVRSTGRVHGDIRAPRVALEEGCQFKGNIDMEPGREAKAETRQENRQEGADQGGNAGQRPQPAPVAAAGAVNAGQGGGGGQGKREGASGRP